ncbi:MAG: biotin--[acetyl-CoA-carboxylase] ligase [Treponemataceae bacterium]
MVNNKKTSRSTKALVLTRLRELRGASISGEVLAAELGISRVAVWKAVESLREVGYAADTDEGGYRLDPSAEEDFLYPWEFGERENRFLHYDETTSTMDRARELAERGAPAGTVVVAERQSAGRGRAGRSWESSSGGLFFTVIIEPGTSVLRYARVSLAAQLAIAAAVRKATGAEAKPRWQNDVYVGSKKIAGVLVEFEAEGDVVRRMTIGVGVNVNNKLLGDGALTCSELAKRKLSRREILNAFIEAFELEQSFEKGKDFIDRWNAAAFGVGIHARFIDARHGETTTKPDTGEIHRAGRFMGIDCFGRAVLETDTGIEHLEAGTTSLRFNDR